MRVLFFILLLVLGFTLDSRAQSLLPQAPNTVWLKDSLYIDQTEIANIHWQEYLFDIQRDSSKGFYQSQLPKEALSSHEGGSLFGHPAYRFHPLMGITYQQVLNFCKWRSEKVTREYRKNHPASKWKFHYRLPTEDEWEFAARGGVDVGRFPYGSIQWEAIDSKAPVEMRPPDPLVNYRNDRYKLFKLVDIYHYDNPNNFGLYHCIGNVAEMVQEEGIAKGGSWRHRKTECKIWERQYYVDAENWLGFRCVCKVQLE